MDPFGGFPRITVCTERCLVIGKGFFLPHAMMSFLTYLQRGHLKEVLRENTPLTCCLYSLDGALQTSSILPTGQKKLPLVIF